jgi:hypothetical protein
MTAIGRCACTGRCRVPPYTCPAALSHGVVAPIQPWPVMPPTFRHCTAKDAELDRLRTAHNDLAARIVHYEHVVVPELRQALTDIVTACQNTGHGNPIVDERIVERCEEIAEAALEGGA